jgi:transaldolase
VVKTIRVFGDGADLETMALQAKDNYIKGWTTNPSLLRKAGIKNYREFGRRVLETLPPLPVSFEVLSGEMSDMVSEAREIASWGKNVFVKIPVLTVSGAFTGPVISRLSDEGVKLNVTAVMTTDQVQRVLGSLQATGSIISIFAGRIADTGVDPQMIVGSAVQMADGKADILWASPREIFNLFQAQRCGADIITLTPDLIAKRKMFFKDLDEYSLETVRQFSKDAEGITL